ncbi:Mss4-like protein [Xylogone sp. PMI_703]|nr:Mss4-like protein [Xylogone sp. PMI_703]
MVSGNCLCGNLGYEITGEPGATVVCHCLTCQRLSGTAFTTNIPVPTADFKLASGTPKSFKAKHHEVDMTLTIYYCPDCGTTIYKESDADAFKGIVLVQAGTLKDGIDSRVPQAELWLKNKAKWLPVIEGTSQLQEFS